MKKRCPCDICKNLYRLERNQAILLFVCGLISIPFMALLYLVRPWLILVGALAPTVYFYGGICTLMVGGIHG